MTTTYDARNAIDGNPATAWRPTEGDGVGQELVLRLPASTTVASVGLVPGYAKTDPATGVDRFAQNRTIARVSWTFDDGTSVQQELPRRSHDADHPGERDNVDGALEGPADPGTGSRRRPP